MKRLIDRFKNSSIKKIITLSQQLNLSRRNSRSAVPSRFLVVSTTGIGDTLWGTPAIKALRETFPEGYIGVLTNPLGFEILKGNPDINGIFIYRRGFWGYFTLPELLKQIRGKYIDVVFIFHASDRIIWPISFFSGATEIIGFHGQNKGLDFILTQAISSQNNIHGIESRLKLVGQVGASASHRTITIHLTNKDKEGAGRFLERNGINENQLLVGLHPGAQKPFKCWPAKNFIEVGNILVESLGCETIITGDSKEKALVEDIASKIKGAIPTAGKLSLRETAAVIERMHLFITNDTGPMHIAFALEIPTIALFSSTDPKLCGPYYAVKATVIEKARTCNPCIGKKCYNPICMEQITVEEVVGFAKELLREKK
jgi:lipopolysaccharide heptosyltransferase II